MGGSEGRAAEALGGQEPAKWAWHGGGEGGEGEDGNPRGGEERRRRERERPTDRRMRPCEVFNWQEGWGFVSLGAAFPSADGRRNIIVPAQTFPFRDMSAVHAPPHPSQLQRLVFCVCAARKARGENGISGIRKRRIAIGLTDSRIITSPTRVRGSLRMRSPSPPRVLGSAGAHFTRGCTGNG